MSVNARIELAAFPPRRAPLRAQTLAAAAAALACAWTLYADPVARASAVTLVRPWLGAALAPQPAIKFGEIKAHRAEIDGQTILYVEGSLRNATARPLTAPVLRVALIGEDGRSIYTWKAKPSVASLAPAGEAQFRTRLQSPPAAFKSIAVSMADDR